MNQQVVLVASSAENSNITAWDVSTGTAIATYKLNASPVGGLALLGRDYLLSTQIGKGSFHFWTWHKDQVHLRSFAPEPLSAVACSPDGVFCAAGGASGALHLWETSTGRLLRSWPAHYKRVTCLAFSDDGAALVSGGEDTLVMAWLLAEVLDASSGQPLQLGGASLAPLHSWSDHTMPVAAVAVGAGGGGAVVASAGGDRTVRVRLLGAGTALRSVAFPAALCSLALDPGEHSLYVGAADGGVYDVSLVGGAESGGEEWVAMEGHTRAVTALGITGDGAHLVSGSEDGSVRVWDLRSRQPVRVLQAPAKGPVTSLLVLDRPPFMHAGGGGGGQGGRKGPKRAQALAPFQKYAGAEGAARAWEGGLVLLDGSGDCTREELEEAAAEEQREAAGLYAAAPAATSVAGGGGGEAAAGGGGLGAGPEAETEDQWGNIAAQVDQFCADKLLSGVR